MIEITNYNSRRCLELAFPNQNNQQKDTHVNTRGIQLFNTNGIEPSTLVISMWNQLVALRIHPAKDKSQQTKSSVYDYDKSVNIVLDSKSADTVANIIDRDILPAIEKGVDCTKGIPIGNNSALIVSTGVKRSSGKVMPYIAIARNIKPGTLVPEEMLSYTFNTLSILNNYDGSPSNADFNIQTCQIPYQSELRAFSHIIRHLSVAMIGGEYHAGRNLNKRYDDNLFQMYKQLAAKNGIEFYSGNGGNGNSGYRGPSVFGSSSNSGAQLSFNTGSEAKPEDAGSIDALDLDAFV